jgi:Flp pilus assembly protein TadG
MTPPRLGDRGAVAVEFALIVFPMLLLVSVIFGVGAAPG